MNRSIHTCIGAILMIAAATPAALASPETSSQRLAQATAESTPMMFDLPAQSLADSLRAVGTLTQTNILMNRQQIGDRQAPAIKGELTLQEVLHRLLDGTGLEPRFVEEKTVVVGDARGAALDPAAADATSAANERAANCAEPGCADGKRDELTEVIVTAQKREERLHDVPVPVSVLRADTLAERNQMRLQDYYNTIPNLTVTPAVVSSQFLAIRGITTGGFSTPTVGVLIDDVPFTPSDRLLGNVVPDIDPSDLVRVEVLRGPQGSLYGASSMGGLLKFVTIDPSMDRVSGRIQIGTSSIRNGEGLGYSARGSINVPVSDTFALRATGFTRQDPGYIDNPLLGVDGVNEVTARGGRVSALWQPSDAFSLKLSALYQRVEGDGAELVYSGLGDLNQDTKAHTGWYDKKSQAYSAVIKAKLRDAELISITGYNINSDHDSLDLPASPTSIISEQRGEKFTQELRVSGPIGQRLEGLLGAFYTHEASDPFIQTGYVTDPLTGALGERQFGAIVPFTVDEYALFAGLTYEFTDRFDVQVGARKSRFSQTQTDVVSGPTGDVTRDFDSEADVFTYLFTPRLRITPNLMAYARLASGYRAGGANTGPIADRGLPAQFKPDRTQNYELGLKADFLDRRLSVETSLYYIDWTDVQLQLFSFGEPILTYLVNGAGAKSQGIELSAEARPYKGLRLAGWVTLGEAELTQDLPAGSTVYGLSGDRLPNGSKVSGNLSIDQDFPVGSDVTGSVGASVIYVGDRTGVFLDSPARQDYPSYTQVDLRAGLQFSSWKASAYVTNATDERGLIGGGIGTFPPNAFFYIRPRSIGVSLTRNF